MQSNEIDNQVLTDVGTNCNVNEVHRDNFTDSVCPSAVVM